MIRTHDGESSSYLVHFMHWCFILAAMRDPFGFPKPLPEGVAGPAALTVALGGAVPCLPRRVGGPPEWVVNLTEHISCAALQ
jgi:hypothetical protein